MKRLNVTIFILTVCVISYGWAIMCYQCNSVKTKECGNAALPESLRQNCSQHESGVRYTLCRKITQHVDYGVNGELPQSRVIRACGWDDTMYKNRCYHRSGYAGRQEVCSCSTDYCNGARETSIVYGLLLSSIFATLAV